MGRNVDPVQVIYPKLRGKNGLLTESALNPVAHVFLCAQEKSLNELKRHAVFLLRRVVSDLVITQNSLDPLSMYPAQFTWPVYYCASCYAASPLRSCFHQFREPINVTVAKIPD
jgi:hypothetical protein